MRILVCTHHLHTWAGSELVALELHDALAEAGHEVSLFCPFADPKFVTLALPDWQAVLADPALVDLGAYDVVFDLHQTIVRLLGPAALDRLGSPARPAIVQLHLSPSESLEAPGVVFEPGFADLVLANSEETRAALVDKGLSDVRLFQNPAPAAFAGAPAPDGPLRRILSVSNHLPDELSAALTRLSGEGVEVIRLGHPGVSRRLLPEDLATTDAVVSIGKTVQYALRARRPVFVYDRFQGPGWLPPLTEEAEANNFSGRCTPVPRSAEALAAEIRDGYEAARAAVADLQPQALRRFHLEIQIEEVLAEVTARAAARTPPPAPLPPETRSALRREAGILRAIDREYEERLKLPTPLDPWDVPAIDPRIETVMVRDPAPGQPLVMAAFSSRYDRHLVPGLVENLSPAVHGYVHYDDQGAEEALSNEAIRQHALVEAARQAGARWVLAVDPDERFEDRLAAEMPALTTLYGPVVWTFRCREMWGPDRYRIDGIWGGRSRARLFPCLPGMGPDGKALHGAWTANEWRLSQRDTGLSFYHLRMASAERRKLRRGLYAANDPGRRFQTVGYDYLDDETGMRLVTIPQERRFSPAFTDDGGLWAAPGTTFDPAASASRDPLPQRLRWLAETRRRGGHVAALPAARELAAALPGDVEMQLLAADTALQAGEAEEALGYARQAETMQPEPILALTIAAEALMALGRVEEAEEARAAVAELLPPGAESARGPLPGEAAWRRWVTGPAEVTEPKVPAESDLAAIVIGLGAPASLAAAVASLRQGGAAPEIVVVNSGGGDARAALGDQAPFVRLVAVEERLMPGAARNVGIDASRAPYVSFLAADCLASPGWTERRLALHRAGHAAVSAGVTPAPDLAPLPLAAHLHMHISRDPAAPLASQLRYSLSYDRALFGSHGHFPPGARIGEDTAFNDAIRADVEIADDPELWLRHDDPETLEALLDDTGRRAARRVFHRSFPRVRSEGELQALARKIAERRGEAAKALLAAYPDHAAESGEVAALIDRIVEADREATLSAGRELLAAQAEMAQAQALAGRDLPAARALAEAAVARAPQVHALHAAAVRLHARAGADGGEAVARAARRAIDIHPGDATVLVSALKALLELHRVGAAAALLSHALRLAPGNLDVLAAANRFAGPRVITWRLSILQRAFLRAPDGRFDAGKMNEAIAMLHRRMDNGPAATARDRLRRQLG
ncbi:glycosyltransferase [Pseudoroseicyclus sp. CXY001]|uniref:glycosyltransferase n=1 Tax=Pseudoroseicyclus sp. CXY001 TaxID=3242492 RepID=UPI0035715AD6